MKIYEYGINLNGKIVCKEKDGFEEKAKTYCSKNGYPNRIKKTDIGVLNNGFLYPTLWLLERDDEKAKMLFEEYYREKIATTKQMCEKNCREYQERIDSLRSDVEMILDA